MNAERCFASKAKATIIDVIHPKTGLSVCFGRDLANVRKEYPDAEEMTVEAFCAWKADQQRTPIEWAETTEERYMEMLEVLPPAWGIRGYDAFLVGEAMDHDAGNGMPRYQGFRTWGRKRYEANRPLTVQEMKAELDKLGYR